MVIRHVAVLGAGVMGAQIAAHFANAGVPALLLDVTPDAARDGLTRARSLRPDPFFTPDTWKLISTGGFDELARIQDCDWILEAIVEQLDIKRSLLAQVDAARRPGSIVSSNTSGIPIAALAEGRDVAHARRRRHRYARAPYSQSEPDAPGVRGEDGRAQDGRREGWPGFLQAGKEARWRLRDPHAGSCDARIPAAQVSEAGIARGRRCHRRSARACAR